MRRILSLMLGIREVQIERTFKEQPQLLDRRIGEAREMFRMVDSALNGLTMTGGVWDTPNAQLGEAMTTSDFQYALGEFVQRRMEPSYNRVTFNFEAFTPIDTVPNYMPVTRYQSRAGLDDLEYVAPKGEPRPGSKLDAVKRQYRVHNWSKQFDFDMQALVNDDLGYFDDMADEMGAAARRTIEKFVSRLYTNATTIARLVALGALYSTTGRLTTARISTARMAFNQRADDRGERILSPLRYIVHHSGLVDTVATIQRSRLVPELMTNAENVVAGTFEPIEDPYMGGVAPDLPWYAFVDYRTSRIKPFVLARRQGVPAPLLLRKRSDIEQITSLRGPGQPVPADMGDFATGNVVVKVLDVWGTYIDEVEGNLYDYRGAYYSSGTAA